MTLPAAAACNAVLGPSKIDRNWDAQERSRFTFYARPGSFAAANVDQFNAVLEYQCDATSSMLDVRYAGHIDVFLYDSAADADFMSERSGTAYPDTQAVRAVCSAPIDANLFLVLSHECNHVVIGSALGQAGTYAMNEGLATAVVGERYHSLGRHFFYPWTRTHGPQLPALTALVDDRNWNGLPQDVAYNASASFLAWLLDSAGASKLKQLYYARSSAFAGRAQQVYGRSLEGLDAEWRAYCAAWVG